MSVHVIVLDLLCPGNELLFAVRVKKRTKKRKSQLMFYKSIPYRRISWKVCPKYGNNRHQGYCVGLSLSRKWIPFCCSCKKKTTKKGGLFSRVDQNGVLEKTELQWLVHVRIANCCRILDKTKVAIFHSVFFFEETISHE